VKRAARIVLLTMLLSALPLRGYAGVLMALCDSHHGGAASAGEQVHEHGDSHHHDADGGAGEGAPSPVASVCSFCASCCASAGIAPDTNLGVEFSSPDSGRIPFFGRQISGFVPDHLERPPLPL